MENVSTFSLSVRERGDQRHNRIIIVGTFHSLSREERWQRNATE